MSNYFSNTFFPKEDEQHGNTDAFHNFQETFEMLQKNKISRANAFERRMEGEIDEIFRQAFRKSNDEGWKRSSTFLDAYGKIYGYCVDHLYEESFKVLGGVNRTSENTEPPENKVLITPRRPVRSDTTLEENESSINFKDFERCKNTDPYFMLMSKKFDSSVAATMLLNTSWIDSELNIILAAEDRNDSQVLVPGSAEVNLEGVVTFSMSDLVELECCKGINDTEDKFLQCSGIVLSSEEILQKMGDGLMLHSGDLNESVASEEIHEGYHDDEPVFPSGEPKNLEEMLMMENNFVFFPQNPGNTLFLQSSLVKDVTAPQKRKKRLRPQSFKDEKESEGYCILKIDEDFTGANLLSVEERQQYRNEKLTREVEEGYREGRLGELFTRRGKFVGISYLERGVEEQEGFDPLCIDPLGEEIGGDLIPHTHQGFLNIKVLKETIWKLCERTKQSSFLDILFTLPDEVAEKELEHFSAHTCFVAMLHLANEHSLSLNKIAECNFQIQN